VICQRIHAEPRGAMFASNTGRRTPEKRIQFAVACVWTRYVLGGWSNSKNDPLTRSRNVPVITDMQAKRRTNGAVRVSL